MQPLCAGLLGMLSTLRRAPPAAPAGADSEGAVDGPMLKDALRWARYAAAAYGSKGYLWTVEGKG